MSLGLMEQLTHSTVRMETNLHGGGVSTGTGFYMHFLQKNDTCVPVIVTNKHVVANASIGKFHVTLATNDGLPDTGKHQQFQFPNFEQQCIKHPDQNVDLAAFLIGPLLNQVQQLFADNKVSSWISHIPLILGFEQLPRFTKYHPEQPYDLCRPW